MDFKHIYLKNEGLLYKCDKDSQAVYVVWGCTAPENNVWEFGALPLSPVNKGIN